MDFALLILRLTFYIPPHSSLFLAWPVMWRARVHCAGPGARAPRRSLAESARETRETRLGLRCTVAGSRPGKALLPLLTRGYYSC